MTITRRSPACTRVVTALAMVLTVACTGNIARAADTALSARTTEKPLSLAGSETAGIVVDLDNPGKTGIVVELAVQPGVAPAESLQQLENGGEVIELKPGATHHREITVLRPEQSYVRITLTPKL